MASKEETTPEEEMECKSFEKSPEGHMMEESAEKTELVAGDTTTFEEFLSLAGTNSFWNHGFACLLFIGSIPPTLIGFSYQFLGTTPEYWCHIQDLYDANWTSQEIIDFAIPSMTLSAIVELCIQPRPQSFMLGHSSPLFLWDTLLTVLELSSSKLRTYLSCMWNISFAIGQMLIPLIAYYIREWRYMYLAFLSTYAYAISYFCFLPESPRWLILRGRYKDAINFLKTVARWNGRTLPSDEGLMEMMRRINIKDTEENNQGGRPVRLFLDQLRQLFETKIKIVRTLILFFSWFTITFVYYGVTLISINLGSNEYWYMFFGGLMELPVCFILWPLTHFFGRRLCMASSLLLCVACLLGSLGVEGSILWKTTLALLGKLGISSAFLLVYLLTAEINTTKTRTLAVGISSTVARFGGVSSPYINDILYSVETPEDGNSNTAVFYQNENKIAGPMPGTNSMVSGERGKDENLKELLSSSSFSSSSVSSVFTSVSVSVAEVE
ncbi:organic cation transporter 1-like isoform X3 [Oratosquilla oratoria]|uniref:organic cation transporter 1-like isoform X3 n=1 Tax=Oratosquilla oratoria TaxID=337810 RepID=UPI003F772B1A